MKQNILDFCDESTRIRNRLQYEQSLKQQADQARKQYFAYRSHSNLVRYLNSKRKLRKVNLI